MAVELNSENCRRFLKARQELKLTQLELEEKSRVSLRTIKDLESGRRRSFNEDTLIRLCRALELDCNELLGGRVTAGDQKKRSNGGRAIGAVLIGGLLLVPIGYILLNESRDDYQRIDWVGNHEKLIPTHFNPALPPDTNAINVNWFHLNKTVYTGDTLPAEIKWSYHFINIEGRAPSTPEFHINAFARWNPEREIELFTGVLKGEGSDTLSFEVICPEELGLYTVRVFFASSFGPVASYYGRPPPNQLVGPSTAPCLEIPIEVLPK